MLPNVLSMLAFLYKMLNYDKSKITLNECFKCDLRWFNTFLPVYNGVTFFQYIPTRNVYLDACTTGLSDIYEKQVCALPLPKEWQASNIVSLEMINILVGLKVWYLQWAGHRVLIHCDSFTFLGKIARKVFMWLSACNIDLQVVYVAWKSNRVVDLLSRWFNTCNNFQKLQKLVHPITWVAVNDQLLYTDESV